MKIFSVATLGLFLFAGVVLAQGSVSSQVKQLREQFDIVRAQAETQLQQEKDQFEKDFQAKRTAVTKTIQTKKTELENEIKKIKDTAKQTGAKNVYDSFNKLNKETTDQFQKSLNQIADVLDKVKSRTDKAEANGATVIAVRTAITTAETAIVTARAAVTAQAGKVYTFQVGTDATLKTDVGKARQALHADLVKVRDLVKAARDAVHQAAVLLGQIQGVDEFEAPTPTPTLTPTPTPTPSPTI